MHREDGLPSLVSISDQLKNQGISKTGDLDSNVHQGQPLYPLSHTLQIFVDNSREHWQHSLSRAHGKRDLVPARKQVAYIYLELKEVFVPKVLQDLCSDKIVNITTDSNTFNAYIN